MAPPVGLRRGEEAWRVAFERLLERFPYAGPERVAQALRDTNGHAGRAAAALRRKSDASSRMPQTARAASPGPAEPQVSRLRSELREERLRAELRAERDARRAERAAAESATTKKARENSREWTDEARAGRSTSAESSEVLVEALAREGRRLRNELDGALAEARAERCRADFLAEAGEVSPPVTQASLDAAQHVRLLQAEAAAADAALSSSRLQTELEASRDEGRRLRNELQGALEAGAAGAAGVVAGSERERLRRELEIALKAGAAAAAAAAEARSRSSRLQAELDAVLSGDAPVRAEAPLGGRAVPQVSPFTAAAATSHAAPVAPQLTPRRPSTVTAAVPTTAADTAGAAVSSTSGVKAEEASIFSFAQNAPPARADGFSSLAESTGEGGGNGCSERGTQRAADAEWRRARDRAREQAPANLLRQSTRATSADELRSSGAFAEELRPSGERLCTPEAPGTPPRRARGASIGSGLAPESGAAAERMPAGDFSTKVGPSEAGAAATTGTKAKLGRPPWELRQEYRHECGRLRDKLAELRATFATAGAAAGAPADAGAGLGQDVSFKAAFSGLDQKIPCGGSSAFTGVPPDSGMGRHHGSFGGSACGAGEASYFSSWRRDPVSLERLEQLWQRS